VLELADCQRFKLTKVSEPEHRAYDQKRKIGRTGRVLTPESCTYPITLYSIVNTPRLQSR
jgi:hypothetical protein